MIVRAYQDLAKTPHPVLDGIMLRHFRNLEDKKVENLNLRIFEVLPGTENPLHTHGYAHDLFVIQGKGIVHLDTIDENIKAGDLVSIEPNEAHSFANMNDDLLQFLCIDYRSVDDEEGMKQIPELASTRITLRAFREGDVEDLYRILQNPQVLRYFPSRISPSLSRVETLVKSQQKHWDEHGYGWWALADRESEALIGWCGLSYLPDTDEVELKYLLAENAWGKGIATEASLLSLNNWKTVTEANEIVGLAHPENIASQRVLEKVGMSFVDRAHYFGMDLLRYTLQREG